MRTILNTLAAAYVAAALAACALLQPLEADDDARRAAKITLTAYEAAQQAILIYARLPTCDAEAGLTRLCRNAKLWTKIKTVEAAATKAIAAATPVLNGAKLDEGELVAALIAIGEVKSAVAEAQTKLTGATP
jgi:predicted small lipoprotein YifL